MTVLLALTVTAWHLFLLRSAWERVRNRIPPRPAEFAVASFVIYYDVGLLLDAVGIAYSAPGFYPLSGATIGAQAFVYLALILVPPVILLTAHFGRNRGVVWSPVDRRLMSPRQEKWFLLVFSALALVAVSLTIAALVSAGSIPGARLEISRWLGPGAVLLYFPISLAAYYCMTLNSQGRRGIAISIVLATVASLGVLALGQRTLVLLPFVILFLCQFRFSFVKLAAAAGVAMVVVVGLGLAFKPVGVSGSEDPSLLATVNESLARAPVLASAFERSEPVGTTIMAYPGQGYVTAFLFFVPREIAPFKGETTAQRFTDAVQGEDRGARWGFGIGMIEEASLNVGWAPALLVLAAIGWALGALEGIVRRRPPLLVPIVGGALWLCGYHLFAIFLLFGVMFIVMLAVDMWFFGVRDSGTALARTEPQPGGSSKS